MARGWESKSVEMQMEDRERRPPASGAAADPAHQREIGDTMAPGGIIKDDATAEAVDVIDLQMVDGDEQFALECPRNHVPDLLGEMREVANGAAAGPVRGAERLPDEIRNVGLAASFSFGLLEKHARALLSKRRLHGVRVAGKGCFAQQPK